MPVGLFLGRLPRTKFKCWENKWWLPPACRANPFHCMSLITGGNGWGIGELTQQISSHNMPMAFAVATDNAKWREENKKLGGFLYWWNPDSSFVAYNPALVEMPPWSLSEYNQGIYNSQIETHLQERMCCEGKRVRSSWRIGKTVVFSLRSKKECRWIGYDGIG